MPNQDPEDSRPDRSEAGDHTTMGVSVWRRRVRGLGTAAVAARLLVRVDAGPAAPLAVALITFNPAGAVPGAPDPQTFADRHRVFAIMLRGAAVELPYPARTVQPP